MGIAVGEAACRPVAGSLIADYFSADHRAKVVYFSKVVFDLGIQVFLVSKDQGGGI
jgi:hypothetical protein